MSSLTGWLVNRAQLTHSIFA